MRKTKFKQWFLDVCKCLETPHMNLVEWADRFRILGRETSAEAGQWNTDRTPYMREIMLAISDKKIQKITVMSSAQVGKSELGLNLIGYIIDVDPRSMLIVYPTEDTAKMFSVERIEPMIKNTPQLKKKIAEEKSRDKQNTILNKAFEGGFLSLVGANTPNKLASRPVGVVILDEVDRFPTSAGKEGDPVSLAIKRTTTFFDRKIIQTSTPVIKGESRIEKSFNEGSMGEWCLPCPKCGNFQPLDFNNFDCITLTMTCPTCENPSSEFEWKKGMHKGRWIHSRPERIDKSYHLNAFTSPWVTWKQIGDEYLEASSSGEEMLKTFWNLSLGLPYEQVYSYADSQKLFDSRVQIKKYPNDIMFFTCGVDTQDHYLQFDIRGWTLEDKSYGVMTRRIEGSPTDKNTWNTLFNYMTQDIEMQNDTKRKVGIIFVDSGGHYTSDVYRNCYRLQKMFIDARVDTKIAPIKGLGGTGKTIVSHKMEKKIGAIGKDGYVTRLVEIAVNPAKTRIMEISNPDSIYFRSVFPNSAIAGYDLEYFEQLFSEQLVEVKKNGKVETVWQRTRRRNEALDCAVYSYAAFLKALGGKNKDDY